MGIIGANLALQAAPAIAGLLFGENSIFSGKGRQARQKMKSDFEKSQAAPIDAGYTDWYNRMQSMGNMGLSGATRGLMNESFARQQGSMMGALRSKRSLLGGISQVADAGNEFLKRQGEMNENMLMQNRRAAAEAAFRMGGIRTQDRLRKEEEARQFWGMRKAESDQSISRNLASIGQAVGAQSYYSALNPGSSSGGGNNSGGGNPFFGNSSMGMNPYTPPTASVPFTYNPSFPGFSSTAPGKPLTMSQFFKKNQ